MIIKSNTEELIDISLKLDNQYRNFYEEIKFWQEEISNLKTNWSGVDAEIFYKKQENYLEQLLILHSIKKELGGFVGHASKKYTEKDEEFYQEMKKENDLNEPEQRRQ